MEPKLSSLAGMNLLDKPPQDGILPNRLLRFLQNLVDEYEIDLLINPEIAAEWELEIEAV